MEQKELDSVKELSFMRFLLDESGVDPLGLNHLDIARNAANCGKDALLALICVESKEPWWGDDGAKTPLLPKAEMLAIVDGAIRVAERHPDGWAR